MTKNAAVEDLLSFFPEVELPITFSDELAHAADSMNTPIPLELIDQYIIPWEGGKEIDEFTEFVPILRLPQMEHFHAIVYWKGGLLKYEFILVTMDKSGTLIARKPIASTISEGNIVKKSVGQIDEDFIIHIMAGENLADESYDPSRSQAFNMEILYTGDIIFSLGDD